MIKLDKFEEALIVCLLFHLSVVGAVVPRTWQPLSQHSPTGLPELNEPSRADGFWHFTPFDVRTLHYNTQGISLCHSTASYTDTVMLIYGLFLKLYFGNSFKWQM